MAKKNQSYRKKNQKSIPWLLVVLGGGLLLLAAALFANRSGDGGGTPAIVVDQQKVDYGYVKFGETRTIAVKVTNTGDGTLRFQDQPYIEVVEGC
jgi:oxalate decarboxylase/phosphoglucose isomerase-like protein (cupin superfamily)